MSLTFFTDTDHKIDQADMGAGHECRAALLDLLAYLRSADYSFVTATPATHAKVVARSDRQIARNVRDVLGWSLPFAPDVLPPQVFDLLQQADVVSEQEGRLRATIRVSTLRGSLFLHSAYPTLAPDSIFFGPDSYRFADLIVAERGAMPVGAHVLDYGAGSGVGGITAVSGQAHARLTLADLNLKALFLASINAAAAGLECKPVQTARPSDIADEFDLIVTHPPFMIDPDLRAYRDGGDLYGARLSLDWVCEAMRLLRPGGRLILHTGVSIVDGRDVLLDAVRGRLPAIGWQWDYRELDPDIFGDELDHPHYAEVERIAAVGLVLTRSASAAAHG